MKYGHNICCFLFFIYLLPGCISGDNEGTLKNDLRAPAYPLVTIDPYTSAWSMTDKLYDESVKHWTGKEFPLIGAIRVDGETYRFMGVEQTPIRALAAISTEVAWAGKFTFSQPEKNWEELDFSDKSWKEAQAAYGTSEGFNVNTLWNTKDIWIRRYIHINEDLSKKKIYLKYSHDDVFELFINGVQVVNTGNEWNINVWVALDDEVMKSLQKGNNVIAAHCHNTSGGALVDFGLYIEDEIDTFMDNTAEQKAVDVQATHTYYTFECGNIELKLSFMAPLLLEDLYLVSRPINYISYEVKSLDGLEHDVQIYFETSPLWALNNGSQKNKGEGFDKDGYFFLKTGSVNQKILGKRGDDIRIDWGHLYLCAENKDASYQVGNSTIMRNMFVKDGKLAGDVSSKENANIAVSHSLGKKRASFGKVLIGYDDIYSIQFFKENLRPLWNKKGDKDMVEELIKAHKEYSALNKRCVQFDRELMFDARNSGGEKYAELCALAYRQAISAHKIVESPNGELLFFSKENLSGGMLGTVDVTYPSIPLFLYYNVDLVKALLNPIFYYSESGRWTKPFPAHDIGTYPWANGQTYQADMPVEEAGNMLISSAAITAIERNAQYAKKHWGVLTMWADYLIKNGLKPEKQLCTDDFAGHLAHNANLSIKAIIGIASYSYMATRLGERDVGSRYRKIAKEMAKEWEKMADDGNHFRLTFDQPNTWSQKYNLIWDKVLKLNIFPNSIAEKELKYYLTKQNEYGLPLDSRNSYTKSDWIIWTATLAQSDSIFEQFISPIHRFYNESVSRVPMSDWYYTDKQENVGFCARSVVGGYYIKMLSDKLLD